MNEAEQKTEAQVTDVVCPVCFKPLPYPSIVGQGRDRYHGELRTYYGWCFECEKGTMVVQFRRDDRWLIHKYREAILLDGAGECRLEDDWQVLNALPDCPPIITGPGGDYDTQVTPQPIPLEDALAGLKKWFDIASASITHWLKGEKGNQA